MLVGHLEETHTVTTDWVFWKCSLHELRQAARWKFAKCLRGNQISSYYLDFMAIGYLQKGWNTFFLRKR